MKYIRGKDVNEWCSAVMDEIVESENKLESLGSTTQVEGYLGMVDPRVNL